MVKLLSISNKNSIIDSESIPKSTLQVLFLCSIVGNAVFARKDDKPHESKQNYPAPYRFNDEIETGFDETNRNYKNDQIGPAGWNGMKGVYGYRNSDAFRMMDYLGRNYGFNSDGKSLDPVVSSSNNPIDSILRGKDNLHETKGQPTSKVSIKSLIQNHRPESEIIEQKPERLTQISNNEEDEEEEDEVTEIVSSTSTITASPIPILELTSTPLTTTTTSSTTTASPPTSSSPVSESGVPKLSAESVNVNNHREVEGRGKVPSLSTQLTSSTNVHPPTSLQPDTFATDVLKQQQQQHKKNLHNKLSVHQLISESMPTLQMSVSPVYFYNKATKSLVAVPYLIMKSVSKMPLLPNMMSTVGGPGTGGNNLINYVNSPVQLNQKLRSRPINHLAPLIEGFESRETSYSEKLSDLSQHSTSTDESDGSSRWLTVQGSDASHGLTW